MRSFHVAFVRNLIVESTIFCARRGRGKKEGKREKKREKGEKKRRKKERKEEKEKKGRGGRGGRKRERKNLKYGENGLDSISTKYEIGHF